MDEIKWPKNEDTITNLKNIYQDRILGAQEFYPEDSQNKQLTRSSVDLSLAQLSNNNVELDKPPHNDRLVTKCDPADVLDRQVKIQQIVESTISDESRLQIHHILELVSALSSTEKLLLYLRLPTDSVSTVTDPLRQPLNPLGSRTEISQTINWIRTHLEEDPELSLPKQDVYEEYTSYCLENGMKALSTADFGKVMKQVYPRVRPRRLGTRGNSRYCYAGLRKRVKLETPLLPDILDTPKSSEIPCSQSDMVAAASCLVREWAENLLGVPFTTLNALAYHLLEIGSVDARSMAALTVISSVGGHMDDKDKLLPETTGNPPMTGKHREMQIQLQRKIHQREVIREQKRKLQLQMPKCDTRRSKKIKTEHSTPCSSPVEDTAPECSGINYVMSSQVSSPQSVVQGRRLTPVCDSNNKVSVSSSTHGTAAQLPNFSSFHSSPNYNFINNLDVVHDFSKKTGAQSSQSKSRHSPSKGVNLKSICAISGQYEQEVAELSIVKNHGAQNLKINRLLSPPATSNESASVQKKRQQNIPPSESSTLAGPCSDQHNQEAVLAATSRTNKIQIPRLPNPLKMRPTTNSNSILIIPPCSSVPPLQKVKYKAIQPKPVCDNVVTAAAQTTTTDVGVVGMATTSYNNDDQSQQHIRSQPDNTVKQIGTSCFYRSLAATSTSSNSSSGGGELIAKTVEVEDVDVNLATITTTTTTASTTTTTVSTPGFTSSSSSYSTTTTTTTTTTTNNSSITVRERVISIGNIDKDALDDYLYGGSNSQEQEEEIMQYFQNESSSVDDFSNSQHHDYNDNNNRNTSHQEEVVSGAGKSRHSQAAHEEQCEKSDKISQLRLLLEKNLKSTKGESRAGADSEGGSVLKCYNHVVGSAVAAVAVTGSIPFAHTNRRCSTIASGPSDGGHAASATQLLAHRQHANSHQKHLILPSLLASANNGLGAKRRVSFDTHNADSVPPSPNTRRKHFSFTPISPGPHSPSGGGKQSKSSSTNASPFVSPRNTPVPRMRNNCPPALNTTLSGIGGATGNNSNRKCMRSGKGMTLPIDPADTCNISGQFAIPTENQLRKHNLPMSAPPSPMLPYRHKPFSTQSTNYLQTLLDTDTRHMSDFIDKRLQQLEVNATQPVNPKTRLAKLRIDVYNNQMESKPVIGSPDSMSPGFSLKGAQSADADKDTMLNTKLEPSLLIHSADPLSREVSQFFSEDTIVYNQTTNNGSDNLMFRSQSVPLRQMKTLEQLSSPNAPTSVAQQQYYNNQSSFNFNNMIPSACSSVGQTPVPNEFSDFNSSFPESVILNENLDRIFDILEKNTGPCNEDMSTPEVDNFTNNEVSRIRELSNMAAATQGLMLNYENTLPGANHNQTAFIEQQLSESNRNMLIRSQSIDFSGVINNMEDCGKFPGNQPSRSVPSTPLPYFKERNINNDLLAESKSHPSTPLLCYKPVQPGDYLLNGQPVASVGAGPGYLEATNELDSFTVQTNKNSSKDSMLPESFVDEAFAFNEMAEPFSDDLMPDLMAANPSDNFAVTSTNEQQTSFLTKSNGADCFVAGSTEMK